jgi:hypothetical protein
MSRAEFYCLAAMVLHDFGHDGRTNEFPREIEQASIESFSTYVQSCGLSEPDWSLLQRLILETDPRFVGDVHARLSDARPGQSGDELSFEEMAVLVVEADVLASAMKFPGEDLTLSLIQEWAPRYPDRAKQLSSAAGRQGFLKFGARFTSMSARMLGIPELVGKQISTLDPQM